MLRCVVIVWLRWKIHDSFKTRAQISILAIIIDSPSEICSNVLCSTSADGAATFQQDFILLDFHWKNGLFFQSNTRQCKKLINMKNLNKNSLKLDLWSNQTLGKSSKDLSLFYVIKCNNFSIEWNVFYTHPFPQSIPDLKHNY